MEMDRTLEHMDRTQLENPKTKKVIDLIVQIRTTKTIQLIEKLKELTGANQVILRYKDRPEA